MQEIHSGRDRRAAWLLGVPAALTVAVILHHPTLGLAHSATAPEIVAGVARIALANATFHAGVLFMIAAQTLGLWSFADRLGPRKLSVRAGALLYAASTALLVAAGTIDGFAVPLLGRGCVGDSAECASAVMASFGVEFSLIQALTKVGIGSQALALSTWSLALSRGGTARLRVAGWMGLVVALMPFAVLASADASVGPRLLAKLLIPECVWALAAAALLWTSALDGEDT